MSEAAISAAQEACRVGHPEHGCTYGGLSAAHGYWLAVEDCPLPHSDRCCVCGHEDNLTSFKGGSFFTDYGWEFMLCPQHREPYLAEHRSKWHR